MMLKKIREHIFSFRHREVCSISTHLEPEEKYMLYRLASSVSGSVFVEIGSYLGASSCVIAEGMVKSGGLGSLYCVDTWKNDAMSEGERDTYAEFVANTRRYGDRVRPIRSLSHAASKYFEEKIDFIFIDGDHSYEGVKRDVDSWFGKLSEHALIVFHDIGWAEGVQRVVREEVQGLVGREGRLGNMWWGWLK